MAEFDQQFDNFDQWVNKAPSWLTRHPNYRESLPWTHAVCVDAAGRICRVGAHFMRARDENTFPIRWWWPDEPIEELCTHPNTVEKMDADGPVCSTCRTILTGDAE